MYLCEPNNLIKKRHFQRLPMIPPHRINVSVIVFFWTKFLFPSNVWQTSRAAIVKEEKITISTKENNCRCWKNTTYELNKKRTKLINFIWNYITGEKCNEEFYNNVQIYWCVVCAYIKVFVCVWNMWLDGKCMCYEDFDEKHVFR